MISRPWEEWPALVCWAIVVMAAVWLGTAPWSIPLGDNSPEAGFARDMAVHHAQAVEMADLVRLRTRDPEVRFLATDIVLTQQAQIGQITGWLEEWRLPPTGREPAMAWMGHPTIGHLPGMATRAQVRAIATAPPDAADVLFLRAMIPHHRAGILMAEAVLNRTDRHEVSRFARGIEAAQRGEITVMEQMLRDKGASAVTPAVTMPGVHPARDNDLFEGFDAAMTARLLPLAAGVLALAWLGVDAVRRRRRTDTAHEH